jgi:hypothetical protein
VISTPPSVVGVWTRTPASVEAGGEGEGEGESDGDDNGDGGGCAPSGVGSRSCLSSSSMNRT